jgi:hypothetical protein
MRKFVLSILLLSILPMVSTFGGARHFTYLYEAPTSAPGTIELENWLGRQGFQSVVAYE